MAMTNREVVEGFLGAIPTLGVRKAFEQYAAEDYIQHNPNAAKGREGAIAYIEAEVARGARGSIKRIIAEGNLVAVHLHLEFADERPGLAIVDIWRIENGKLAEHWDVIQEIPKTSISGNSMF